ncbi:MAG: hypothetical protein LBU14_03065 [Candidatus Peribacteria bacterium]|nr:hypothetical protein [Candidatus Peribacteria bacterium]
MFLNLSSNSPLNYKLKVIKFDKDEYEFKNTLIPIEISESIALTST